jgi:two-component system LytT family response regulator
MLSEIGWLTVAGEAANGLTAVETINRLRPELVFLDIQMPGLIGTEVLRQAKHQPYVIFTTAFAQHAATAFELGALDYLLKPFGPERLAKSLERIRAVLGEPASPPAFDRLREALGAGPMSRLFVRTGNGVVPVSVESVAWFEASGDYVTAVTPSSKHLMHVSLNRLEARLDPARFVRIHRAHIVNLDHVAAFRRTGRGFVAEMKSGVRLPVSRERAKDVRSLSL